MSALLGGQRVYYSPRYIADIGDHIMPIHKFALVQAGIEATGLPARFVTPAPISDDDLLRVHTREYIDAIASGTPIELAQSQKFPWSAKLADAVRWTNGGTVEAAFAAMEDGVAGNLASGFHHSHAAYGEGFCTFNGLIIALEKLKAAGRIRRGLVLDMDLHYGNGTASLLAPRPDFYQMSIYGNWYKKNLAYRDVTAERAPDTANAWSVPVPAGANGFEYLDILNNALPNAIEWSNPDILLYQAGADPYREDPYSPLDLGHEDLRARDEAVFETARRMGIPVMWVLAGGYTKDVTKVVEVHVNTFRASHHVFG